MGATSQIGLSILDNLIQTWTRGTEVIDIANRDDGDRMRTCTPEVTRIAAARTGYRRARPHLTHQDMADITALEAARQCFPGERGPRDPAPSLTALVARAAVTALAASPLAQDTCDIGIALNTNDGLMVPVVRDAARQTARELAVAIERVTERARRHALTPADTAPCTLVIADQAMTNVAAPGATAAPAAAPVLCLPGVTAVLAVGRARVYPVEWEGALQERLYLPLSLTYDHRMLASADAARLTRAVADLLANPLRLLMAR